jgi:hypothetical protein
MMDWDELPLGERIRLRAIARAVRAHIHATLAEQGRSFSDLSRQERDALLDEAFRAVQAEHEAMRKDKKRKN